jgi:hypothetical protein
MTAAVEAVEAAVEEAAVAMAGKAGVLKLFPVVNLDLQSV